jgi:hypothetical protein
MLSACFKKKSVKIVFSLPEFVSDEEYLEML